MPSCHLRAEDRVRNVEVDLRAVERAVAGLELVREVQALERGLQRSLGAVPHRVVADPLRRPGRELRRVLQPERVVDVIEQLHEPLDLVGDLVLAAVDVRVVLRELADAGQAAERTGRFVAVEDVLRVEAHRQVAIALLLEAVVEVVRRAVHRLQREVVRVFVTRGLRLAVLDEEHVLLVLAPVAADLPQALVVEERRLDLDVAVR